MFENLWSVDISGIPYGLDKGYLSKTFKIPHEHMTNPKQHKSRTRTIYVNHFDNEEMAKDFAIRWAKSNTFRNALKCTAFPSKDIQLRLVRLKFVSMLKNESLFSQEPITSEEKAYYNGCKQYYRLTEMPIISIPSEVLNKGFQPGFLSFKFAIDENYDQCNIADFLGDICSLLDIDGNNIDVRKIQKGSVLICFDYMIKKINNKETEIKIQVNSIYEKLTDKIKKELGKMKVFFMFIGDISNCAVISRIRHDINLYPQYNRIYGPAFNYWRGALHDGRNRGDSPYYCPVGWKRYSFYVSDDFEKNFNGKCICYHGIKFEYGLSILLSGLKPADIAVHDAGIHVSPSIIYAAHPRYSEIKKIELSEQNAFFKHGRYVQFVLECRVHPKNRKNIEPQTLCGDNKVIIDPNISNDKLEWLITNHGKDLLDLNDPNASIICSGLMIRITDNHPRLLPDSKWWDNEARNGLCNIIYS